MSVCSTCHGGCCRRYSTGITGYDILNISRLLELPPLFFVDVEPITNEHKLGYIGEYNALFKFTDDGCKYFHRFRMKKVESLLMPDTKKCIFLQEWFIEPDDKEVENILGRCGIYSCRPYTCAAYPAQFSEERMCGKVPEIGLLGRITDTPAYRICPKKFSKEDFGENTEEVMKNLIRERYEMQFFRSIAENWNKNPFSIEQFLFVMPTIYADRVFFESESES